MSVFHTPMFSINDLVLVITMLECFVLAGYIFFSNGKTSLKSSIFSAFLFVTVIEITTNLVMWNYAIPASNEFRHLTLPYLYMFCQLIKGPTILLFIYAATATDFKLKTSYLWHLVPLAFVFIFISVADVTTSRLNNYRYIWLDTEYLVITSRFMLYAVNLVAVSYVLSALFIVRRYHQRLQDYYSSISNVEVKWLVVLCVCFSLGWSWYLVMAAVADHIGGKTADFVGALYNYLVFILTNILFTYSFFYSRNKLSSNDFEEKVKEKEDVSQDSIDKVESGISDLKLHLEPNITIEVFANRVGLSSKLVSEILNKHLNTKFFEFINFHRIEEAKKLLGDESLNHHNILEILLMAGFNNKSSFHRFFNRLVNECPSEYRKRVQVEL